MNISNFMLSKIKNGIWKLATKYPLKDSAESID